MFDYMPLLREETRRKLEALKARTAARQAESSKPKAPDVPDGPLDEVFINGVPKE